MVKEEEDARRYLSRLHAENKEFYDSERGRGALDLLQQTFPEPWLYVAELIQNAVDAKATILRFVVDADTLTFEHDGKPFEAWDVRGLCSQALSTKGFATVGFMGVGFKAVFAAFEQASMVSGPWRFSLTVPVVVGPYDAELRDWLGSVLPVWDEHPAPPSSGMKCRFVLRGRRSNLGAIEDDLDNVFQEDGGLLALLAVRGIRQVDWKGQTWLLECNSISSNGFIVRGLTQGHGDGGTTLRSWVTFLSRYTPSDAALRRLVEHRRQAVLHGDPTEAKRERDIWLFCEVDERTVPRLPAAGRAFALLPTNLMLPLRVHIDAEWLLVFNRREPMRLSGDPWHEEILGRVSGLLGDYVAWIASRSDVDADELKEALEALPEFRDEAPTGWSWFLQRVRDDLRRVLSGISFVSALPSDERAGRLSPEVARFLPKSLAGTFEEAPSPSVLFGPTVGGRKFLGGRAQSCLVALGLWNELGAAELVTLWEQGRVGDWYDSLPDADRNRWLTTLLSALGELVEKSADWAEAPLRCVPTNFGGWITRGQAVRLPGDWDSIPQEIQINLLPCVGPAERVVRWEVDRAVVQRSPRRHYLVAVQPTPLEDLTLRWWASFPEGNLSASEIEEGRRFASWVRAKAPQRRDLVRKLLCRAADGGTVLRNGEDTLLTQPYAGSWRQVLFPALPAVTADYLRDSSATVEWRRFLESGEYAPRGEMCFMETTEVLSRRELIDRAPTLAPPSTRYSALTLEWRGNDLPNYQYGWVRFYLSEALGGKLADEALSTADARAISEWLSEAVGSFPQYARCRLAYIPWGYGHIQEDEVEEQVAPWVALLQHAPWIATQVGTGPFAPADVLARRDTARPNALVADLPEGLIADLEQSGIRFGNKHPRRSRNRQVAA